MRAAEGARRSLWFKPYFPHDKSALTNGRALLKCVSSESRTFVLLRSAKESIFSMVLSKIIAPNFLVETSEIRREAAVFLEKADAGLLPSRSATENSQKANFSSRMEA